MTVEVCTESAVQRQPVLIGLPVGPPPRRDSSEATFCVLHGDDTEDVRRWTTLWESWPTREVFAHPGYVKLFTRNHEQPRCACWHDGRQTVLYPFVLRDISKEPYWKKTFGPAFDLVTPYGYGGPFLFNANDPGALSTAFWNRFDAWAKANHAVSEFIRFTLFADDVLEYPGTVKPIRNNVIRDLRLDDESLWMDFKHKVRKNVKKAQRNGLRVELDLSGTQLGDFLRIYQDTLTRRNARADYFFPRSFFERLHQDLAGQFAYFHVVHDNRVVSTELVMVSARSVYSFLGGTDSAAYDLRPNDLLKYEIMKWARSEGKDWFVLGGGYEPDDGIYRHKLAFAANGAVPFRVGRRTFCEETCERLTRARIEHEHQQATSWQPNDDYFPAYRS